MGESLFDVAKFETGERRGRRPLSEGAALHRQGVPHLEKVVPDGAVCIKYRVRDASSVAADPQRLNEATVRYRTAGGAVTKEWRDITDPRLVNACLAYGWLDRDEDRLIAYIVLHAPYLREDILERPGCLVPAGHGRMLHHAPGGAEFYVVDLRKILPDTVLTSYGNVEWATHPARVAVQEELQEDDDE